MSSSPCPSSNARSNCCNLVRTSGSSSSSPTASRIRTTSLRASLSGNDGGKVLVQHQLIFDVGVLHIASAAGDRLEEPLRVEAERVGRLDPDRVLRDRIERARLDRRLLDRLAIREHRQHELGAPHSGGVRTTSAPSSARASACFCVRFQARTSSPARSRLRAIGAPIIPSPAPPLAPSLPPSLWSRTYTSELEPDRTAGRCAASPRSGLRALEHAATNTSPTSKRPRFRGLSVAGAGFAPATSRL